MAKHIYNGTLEILLTKSNHHRNIDLMLALVDLSSQVKIGKGKTDCKFIVPCYNDAAHGIWNEVNLKYPNFINKATVNDCVKELKELGLIAYNNELNGFEIINMEKMLAKKDKGYTDIRQFFFNESFTKIPFAEKRALLYMIHLMDKKRMSKKFKINYGVDIVCNLNNYRKSYPTDELNWMTICNTNNIYYVKRILDSLSKNYPDLVTSRTNEMRLEKYGKHKGISKGVCVDVIYFFDLSDTIKGIEYNLSEEFNRLSKSFPNLLNKIDELVSKSEITLTLFDKIALLRRLNRFLPFAQTNLINLVINRIEYGFNNENPIRNIEAFIQHIVNTNSQFKYAYVGKNTPYLRGNVDLISTDTKLPF